MDSKTRVKFINSISESSNNPANKHTQKQPDEQIHTVQTSPNNSQKQNVKPILSPLETRENEEIFAQGLPSWDLEPPQVAVRRVRQK